MARVCLPISPCQPICDTPRASRLLGHCFFLFSRAIARPPLPLYACPSPIYPQQPARYVPASPLDHDGLGPALTMFSRCANVKTVADEISSGLSTSLHKLAIWAERAIYRGSLTGSIRCTGPIHAQLYDGQSGRTVSDKRGRNEPTTAAANDDATHATGTAKPGRYDPPQPATTIFWSSRNAKSS